MDQYDIIVFLNMLKNASIMMTLLSRLLLLLLRISGKLWDVPGAEDDPAEGRSWSYPEIYNGMALRSPHQPRLLNKSMSDLSAML